MAVPTRTLRIVLVVLAVGLLAVVVGFVGYAHFRAQRFLSGLPGRLGIDIKQETNNVTYSQSYKGRTIFTVHAAKQIQHQDGKYTLRDVGIVLYGKQGDREDRIRGSEFEYDAKEGVLTAVGDVYLDLAASGPGKPRDERKVIHAKTSGLVYRQKEQTAMTDAPVEWTTGGVTGYAVGASYAGQSGSVVLQSAVRLQGDRAGKPATLNAGHAELDRLGNVVRLESAKLMTQGVNGPETVAADWAVVHVPAGGQATPERVEAEGHVVLTGAGRGEVQAQRMDLELSAKGSPENGHLYGGVVYTDSAAARQERGTAEDARLLFDAGGKPVHATLVGAVRLDEKAGENARHLESDRLELALSGGNKAMLRGAEATGKSGAELRLTDAGLKGRSVTTVQAAKLTGRFGPGGVVTGLDGLGHTAVERDLAGPGGAFLSKDTSTGEVLRLEFHSGANGRAELVRAAQSGGVATVRESAPKEAGMAVEVERSKAADLLYDAASDKVFLSGGVQIVDAGSVLFADHATVDRTSGEGTADGTVRVNYAQAGGGGEPVHVTAARAVAHESSGLAEFFAAPGGKVRMWQAGTTVEAPVIDFDRTGKRVLAKDGVRAVLVGAKGDPVRVFGSAMTYADGPRTLEVAGPVRVEQTGGTLTARQGTVFLAADGAAQKADAVGFAGGKVERVVGVGSVEIVQPGRKATGERLVYTAADETFVLTGKPKMVDEVRGTVTGTSLTFKRGEESVIVAGGDGTRVRTETRVKE